MSRLRSLHSFGKYLLMNVSFSDAPCTLPLGDRDEIKYGLSRCHSSCKMRPLSVLLGRNSASRHLLGSQTDGYHNIETRNFFLLLFSLACSCVKTKSYGFSAKTLSQDPDVCPMQVYLVKLHVAFRHDALKIFLLAAVFLG